MTRKCHNHIRHINPWYDQEDPKNTIDMKFRKQQSTKHSSPVNFTDQIFNPDSAVLKTPSSHRGFLTYVMYHQRETAKSSQLTNTVTIWTVYNDLTGTIFDAITAWRMSDSSQFDCRGVSSVLCFVMANALSFSLPLR